MKRYGFVAICAAFAAQMVLGCEDESRGDVEVEEQDTGTHYDGPTGTLSGTVVGPNGTIPISGALVYVTPVDGPEIPDHAYCYECEDMTGKNWTLTAADGTFYLENVPAIDMNLVVRKGFFQRQREVSIEAGANLDVPMDLTTLPAENSEDGLDQIPNFAVLLSHPDQIFDLLAKFGMGEVSGGSLQFGTETFDVYNDDVVQTGYAASTELFASQETLDHYHMIFLPCYASAVGVAFADSHREMIRQYVTGGGRIYNSCCVAYWTEPTFPEYLEFYGDDSSQTWDVGRLYSSAHSTYGAIGDTDLRDWMAVVLPATDPNAIPFQNGYTRVDQLVPTDDGHGTEEDDYWVVPYSWVDGSGGDDYQGFPLMTTYNYECGKVFYSVYETSPEGNPALIPQEYLLLYIILEVGVCEGDYTVE